MTPTPGSMEVTAHTRATEYAREETNNTETTNTATCEEIVTAAEGWAPEGAGGTKPNRPGETPGRRRNTGEEGWKRLMSIVAATGRMSIAKIVRGDRGLLGMLAQEMQYRADLRRLAEPIVEMPGRFVDVASGFEEMEWSE